MDGEVTKRLDALIDRAQGRYGPFASTHEAMGVAGEEWDELRAAVHSNDLGGVAKESLDLAAVLIRLAVNVRDEEATRGRSLK